MAFLSAKEQNKLIRALRILGQARSLLDMSLSELTFDEHQQADEWFLSHWTEAGILCNKLEKLIADIEQDRDLFDGLGSGGGRIGVSA